MKLNDVLKASTTQQKKSTALSEKAKLEVALQALRDKREGKNTQINTLQKRVVDLENEIDVLAQYREKTPTGSTILPKSSAGASESAAVVVWSDWHSEEQVLLGQVGGKNEFNLEIFDRRCSQLAHGTISWLSIERQKPTLKH